MAVTRVLDTNAVLYALGGRLGEPLPAGNYAVSVITALELLSFPALGPSDESAIKEFLSDVENIDLTLPVKEVAVALRRQHRLKLPDAIIVGTALALGAELITNDARLHQIPDLMTRFPVLKGA
ncbi:type II toxin-antitoxin system VapC family toxin [Azospirillum sp.]|uniref:type II toxin-antitoxin system VapC family toxin n=1 Tax=Azospirillum sp. TaxID=34012 RepID=UPI003D74AE4D